MRSSAVSAWVSDDAVETTGDVGRRRVKGGSFRRRALVVGAGVSGCACAATLAAAGARVTLVNPALDHLGQPGFGPELPAIGGGGERLQEVLGRLPAGLREAWFRALLRVEGEALTIVDRRMLSVEAKRALDNTAGLELRQGLVTWLGADTAEDEAAGRVGSCVRAETAFGERLEGDAVVIAVGLGLRGVIGVGGTGGAAGICAEPSNEGLTDCLKHLGAEFSVSSAKTKKNLSGAGPCLADARVVPTAGRGGPRGRRVKGGLGVVEFGRARPKDDAERAGEPPSPYEADGVPTPLGLLRTVEEGDSVAVLVPDGLVTGEMTVCFEGRTMGAGSDAGPWRGIARQVVSRTASRLEGLVVGNIGPGGRVEPANGEHLAVWVTGRAGGAVDYVESLAAGLRTGAEIACFLGCADAGER